MKITIDNSTFTQEEKNLTEAIVYRIAATEGNKILSYTSDNCLTLDDATIGAKPEEKYTPEKIKEELVKVKDENAIAAAAEQDRIDLLKTEIEGTLKLSKDALSLLFPRLF